MLSSRGWRREKCKKIHGKRSTENGWDLKIKNEGLAGISRNVSFGETKGDVAEFNFLL